MADPDPIFYGAARGPLATALRCQQQGHPDGTDKPPVRIIDAGDDATTLTELAAALAAPEVSGQRPQIVAQIADPTLRAAVEARLEDKRVDPLPLVVSAAGLLAASVVAAHPLFKLAYWRDHPRVHAVMIGFGALGRALLDEIVLDGIADGLDPPLIDIVMANAAAQQASLLREMPDIHQSAAINFIELAAGAIPSLAELLGACETQAPITAIFVLLETPHEVLAASVAICEAQDRLRIALAPTFVAGASASTAIDLAMPRRSPQNLGAATAALGGLETIDHLLDHILIGRDIVARRIHDAYQAQYRSKTAAGTPWEDLAETYRRANRRAARHLPQKLFALNIDSPTDPAQSHCVSEETFASLITPLTRSPVEDDVVRRLARLEHDRWCADRRLDGWVHGEARDDQRRRHPSLIPFDDPRLTAAEIEKDIAQLRFVLGSVVMPAKGGASVLLTIGLIEPAAEEQPGIEETALWPRIDDEPDRDLVLLSGLRSEAELSLVARVAAGLDSRGRRFRLFVVTLQADGGSARVALPALQPRLDMLLARPNTWTVAIGPPDGKTADDWADVTADATAAVDDLLSAYVIKRSAALVTARAGPPALSQTSNPPP